MHLLLNLCQMALTPGLACMRVYRKIADLLSVNLLILLCLPANAYSETAIIQNVELYRRGNQISVRLLTSIPTDYQITENLAAQTLVVKFKKARTGFADGRMERLLNDRQLSGIRFSEFGDDIRAQFKIEEED